MKRYRPKLLQESGLSKLHTLVDDPSISRRIKIKIQKILRLCRTRKYSTKSLKTSRKYKRKAKLDLVSELIALMQKKDESFIPL